MKTIAWTLVFSAGFLFILPFVSFAFGLLNFTFIEYATFVGGTAGPMAALAGYLFVYINFQLQQKQIDKHDEQFKLQSFENTFFNLLNYYQELSPSFSIEMNSKRMNIQEFKELIHDEINLITPKLEINPVSMFVESLKRYLHDRFSKQEKQLQHLIKPLLSIVEHILQYNSSDYNAVHKKYSSILVSQIPDAFLYVYFYMYIAECNSSTSWYYRQKMYHLLHLINDEILVIPKHKEWLEKTPFRAEHPLLDYKLPSYDF